MLSGAGTQGLSFQGAVVRVQKLSVSGGLTVQGWRVDGVEGAGCASMQARRLRVLG